MKFIIICQARYPFNVETSTLIGPMGRQWRSSGKAGRSRQHRSGRQGNWTI